jgi:hypothetical protein
MRQRKKSQMAMRTCKYCQHLICQLSRERTYASDAVDDGHNHRDDGRDDSRDAASDGRNDGALWSNDRYGKLKRQQVGNIP